MQKLLIALATTIALVLAFAPMAVAQSVSLQILPSGCASANFPQGIGSLTMDSTGKLCINTGIGAAAMIQGNATGTTGAVVGTLAAVAGKITYLCDFDISAVGGTAAVGPIVIAGLMGGSKTYQLNSAAAPVLLSKNFNPCLPASAANTAITITTTADGTASAVDVNSSGYQQ